MNFVISILILVVPCLAFGVLVYWLCKRGRSGRVSLMCLFLLGAAAAHSIVYPKPSLKENYVRVIG